MGTLSKTQRARDPLHTTKTRKEGRSEEVRRANGVQRNCFDFDAREGGRDDEQLETRNVVEGVDRTSEKPEETSGFRVGFAQEDDDEESGVQCREGTEIEKLLR